MTLSTLTRELADEAGVDLAALGRDLAAHESTRELGLRVSRMAREGHGSAPSRAPGAPGAAIGSGGWFATPLTVVPVPWRPGATFAVTPTHVLLAWLAWRAWSNRDGGDDGDDE